MDISSLGAAGSPIAQQSPPVPQAQGAAGPPAARPATQTTQASSAQQMPSAEQVQQAIKTVQQMVQSQASNLQFSVDQATGKTVVTVVDTSTNQVIRQIPSKEMIAIAHAIDQMQAKGQGLMMTQKA